jgi:hypothetical protein
MAFGTDFNVLPPRRATDGREDGDHHDAQKRVLYPLAATGIFQFRKLCLPLLLNRFGVHSKRQRLRGLRFGGV